MRKNRCEKNGRKSMTNKLITLLITTKNEEENIGGLLSTLINQEPPIEIVVVDSGSTDTTQKIVESYTKIHSNIKLLVKEGTRGESMNYGIANARGNYIAFIGADDGATVNVRGQIIEFFWGSEKKSYPRMDENTRKE